MKKFLLSLGISLFIISACNNDKKHSESSSAQTQSQLNLPAWDSHLSQRASLIQRVSSDVIFYARIPSIWGLFFSPKKNSLHNALAGQANQNTITTLQQGLEQQLSKLPDDPTHIFKTFLHDLRSPLELAVILPAGSVATRSQMVIEAQLSYKTNSQLNEVLKNLSRKMPQLQLTRAATDQKPGLLSAGAMKVYFYFNEKLQRLTALTGMVVVESDLQQVINWKHRPDLAIYEFQNQIDSSQLGFFQWLNFSRIRPLVQNSIPPQTRNILNKTGLLSTRYFAMGAGVAQGMGTFRIIARGTHGLIWEKGFSGQDLSQIFSVEKPRFAAGYQLPDGKWVDSLVQEIAQLKDTPASRKQTIDKWISLNSTTRDSIHFSITEFLDATAGQWISVSDKAGQYSMLLARHPDKLKTLLTKLGHSNSFSVKKLTSSAPSISELSFKLPPSRQKQSPQILRLMQSRIFYQWRNNIFYVAELPQILTAREQLGAHFAVNDWLQHQNIEAKEDVLWLGTESATIPRRNYYMYLQLLLLIGDILETPIAIESFPTANEIRLPQSGKRGIEIIFAKNEIGFSLNYESHPAEFLMDSNTLATVAVVGILAAIAIPAYEDYTRRALIAAIIAKASPVKIDLNHYYQQNHHWPDANDSQRFYLKHPGANLESIFFDDDLGALVIKMNSGLSKLTLTGENPIIILTPIISGSHILWRCSSVNVQQKLLPKQCKGAL